MGERELWESWESEERKLCEWSETVGTECFESGEGERESGIRELVEKEWYESEESCGSGERERMAKKLWSKRDTVYSECGKRFLFEKGKREQDESVVR